jgi:hypothetical protein
MYHVARFFRASFHCTRGQVSVTDGAPGDMFFCEPPSFEAILAGLAELELEINAEEPIR